MWLANYVFFFNTNYLKLFVLSANFKLFCIKLLWALHTNRCRLLLHIFLVYFDAMRSDYVRLSAIVPAASAVSHRTSYVGSHATTTHTHVHTHTIIGLGGNRQPGSNAASEQQPGGGPQSGQPADRVLYKHDNLKRITVWQLIKLSLVARFRTACAQIVQK